MNILINTVTVFEINENNYNYFKKINKKKLKILKKIEKLTLNINN